MAKGIILGNRTKPVCLCAMLLLAVASVGSADTVVRFQTALGDFDVQLYDSIAPNTVANFLNYVNDGDYANSFFHRLATDFVLQGGGFTYDADIGIENPWPRVPTDAPVVNESNVSNTRGTIAMAKLGGNPDSATNQFFFNLGDNSANLDNQNGGFTVFGEVIGNGMDVVDLLASQTTWPDKNEYDSAFDSIPLINYSGSGPWTPMLEMFDVGFVPGDANHDGQISAADYNSVRTNYGNTGSPGILGDANNDGTVSAGDFTTVQGYYDNVAPPPAPGPGPVAMPEPATLGLLMVIGGLALLSRRK